MGKKASTQKEKVVTITERINEITSTTGHKLSKPFKNDFEAPAPKDPASGELSLHPLKRERFPSACLRHSLLLSKALGADPIRNA